MVIIRPPKKIAKFVDEISTEDYETYFVWLKKPYAFEANPDERVASHCRGMYVSIEEIVKDVGFVEKCPCSYCNPIIS